MSLTEKPDNDNMTNAIRFRRVWKLGVSIPQTPSAVYTLPSTTSLCRLYGKRTIITMYNVVIIIIIIHYIYVHP